MKKNWIALAVTLSISASMAGAFAAQNFSDVKSSWAQSQIDKAVSQNIMTGYNDGMFHPMHGLAVRILCRWLVKHSV